MPLDSFPSADYIRAVLDYWPETGVLRWRARADQDAAWNGRYAGTVAGFANGDGAVRVSLNDHKYLAHRLIWTWMTEEPPPRLIDHLDMDRANNRWENLRRATHSQNMMNRPRPSNNTSGFKGVSWCKKERKWVAMLTVQKKQRRVLASSCIAAARCAYLVAASEAFGSFARTG